MRKIIHIDMDAFYASVEQRDNPSLRGKPVAVGGSPDKRGVIAAASYEARKFGVKSAMSSSRAARLCPELIFVRPDIKKYAEVGKAVRQLFYEITPLVEPLSLDEAYLDVTENTLGESSATKIAQLLRQRIKEQFNLTASAGVGPNKLVAKIASDQNKPDGIYVVAPDHVQDFLAPLSARRIWGIGPVMHTKLTSVGIETIADLRQCPLDVLESKVGNRASELLELANGNDSRQVKPSRDRKSIGTETTFNEDTGDTKYALEVLKKQSDHVGAVLARNEAQARTVTIKVRYANFDTVTRSFTLDVPTSDTDLICATASRLLLDKTEVGPKKIRLLGVSLSNFGKAKQDAQHVLEFVSTSQR